MALNTATLCKKQIESDTHRIVGQYWSRHGKVATYAAEDVPMSLWVLITTNPASDYFTANLSLGMTAIKVCQLTHNFTLNVTKVTEQKRRGFSCVNVVLFTPSILCYYITYKKTNLISTSGKRGSTNYHINWVWYIDQRYRILELNMTLTDSNT